MTLLTAQDLSLGFGAAEPVIRNVDLTLDTGDRLLICGATGAGKTTLLMALAGVIPQITPNSGYHGQVLLGDQDVAHMGRDMLFSRVGFVAQAVEDQLWDLSVEDIIAFPLENRGTARAEVRDRLRNLLEHLELTDLVGRRVLTLSGGERRMVVLAAALVSRPDLLVLDEPTTGLDPAARQRLCRALEHAAEDVSGLLVTEQDPLHLLRVTDAVSLLSKGMLSQPRPLRPALEDTALWEDAGLLAVMRPARARKEAVDGPEVLAVRGMTTTLARPSGRPVLEGLDLRLRGGEVLGVIGRNGAGKTTLMKAILGLAPTASGEIELGGERAEGWTTARRARSIAYVPQSMRQILFHMTVREEVAFAQSVGRREESPEAVLARYGLETHVEANPFALSARQQGQLGLACADASGAAIAIVDEPLLARDRSGRRLLEAFLDRMTGAGRAVMLVSHDLELIDDVATRLAIVGEGTVPFDGEVAAGWRSAAFAQLGWPAPYAARSGESAA